jgi:hypothetical protein
MPEALYIPSHRPNWEEIEKGLEYAFIINDELDFGGTIWRYPDIVCWEYETKPKSSLFMPGNVRQQLVFRDGRGREILQIQPSRELRHTHYILRSDEIVGTIKALTTCRNKYAIQLDGCPLWTFHVPMLKTTFWAKSADGQRVWAKVWKRKQQLRLLVPSELQATAKLDGDLQNAALLPALAFVHREWWCSG